MWSRTTGGGGKEEATCVLRALYASGVERGRESASPPAYHATLQPLRILRALTAGMTYSQACLISLTRAVHDLGYGRCTTEVVELFT